MGSQHLKPPCPALRSMLLCGDTAEENVLCYSQILFILNPGSYKNGFIEFESTMPALRSMLYCGDAAGGRNKVGRY
jgi:hypothetical protein